MVSDNATRTEDGTYVTTTIRQLTEGVPFLPKGTPLYLLGATWSDSDGVERFIGAFTSVEHAQQWERHLFSPTGCTALVSAAVREAEHAKRHLLHARQWGAIWGLLTAIVTFYVTH